MQIVIIGTHQRSCPLAVREQLAFGADALHAALQKLRDYVDQGFILSTCNRVEVGGLVASGATGVQALLQFLAEWHHIPQAHLEAHLYILSGDDAVRHMFQLAAGLDSIVLGEDQVMGQIKAALAAAQAAGVTGQHVNRLLHSALAAGKLVRTRTDIARSHLSTVSVALDIARQSLDDLNQRRILIVGAGKMAELALKHLRAEPTCTVELVSRTYAHAQTLATEYGAQSRPWSELTQAIHAADVVVSCTAAPDIVIGAALVEQALVGRSTPLLMLDQAVPRDIDPRVRELPHVQLFDIDAIQSICDANRAARQAEVSRAELLVEDEVAKFMEWWAAQEVVPTIRALRERAELIRQTEIERTLAKLPDLSPRQQEAIQALSAAIVNKLLHQPIANLKDPAAGGQLALAVQQLFQLTETS